MEFRIIASGQNLSEQEFRASVGNVSLPAVITDAVAQQFGARKIEQTPQPEVTPYQRATSVIGQAADGSWQFIWTVADVTDPDELKAIDTQLESPYITAIEELLDTEARKKKYDNIRSAALRAGYAGPFQAEGTKFAQWMDNCWATAYSILDAVKAGTRVQPTVAEMLAEMPVLDLAAV